MTDADDWKQVVRRNKLVGMWAAAKLGKTGQDAEGIFERPRWIPSAAMCSARFARTSTLRV
jgi:hypothetical protein